MPSFSAFLWLFHIFCILYRKLWITFSVWHYKYYYTSGRKRDHFFWPQAKLWPVFLLRIWSLLIMARFFPLNVQILGWCSAQNMVAWLSPDSAKKNWHFLPLKKRGRKYNVIINFIYVYMAIFNPESWHIIWPKLAIQTGQNMAITLLHLHSFSSQKLWPFSRRQTENGSFFLFNFSTRVLISL